jgi:hypothetical protein
MLEYFVLFLSCSDILLCADVHMFHIYMLVERSEWGPSSFQCCTCVLAVPSPAAATHNKNKYGGTQRNDARQFCKLPT